MLEPNYADGKIIRFLSFIHRWAPIHISFRKLIILVRFVELTFVNESNKIAKAQLLPLIMMMK